MNYSLTRWTAFLAGALLIAFAAPAPSARAEVVDRIVAVINDSIITLSELNAATVIALDKLPTSEREAVGSEDEIKASILDQLIEQKLVKQASDRAGIDVSEREIDNAVEEIKQQNKMTQEALMVALARSGLTYREYREQLREQIREVKFVNKEFRSKISIQDEDIEDHYQRNLERFYAPPAARISMIFIDGADEAKKRAKLEVVKEGLAEGEGFAALASQYSDSASSSSGGDMGYLNAGELSSTLESAVNKLEPGSVSPPIVTPEGVYLIMLTDRREAAPRPLEEVRAGIRDALFKKVMAERFSFWLSGVKKYAHVDIRL